MAITKDKKQQIKEKLASLATETNSVAFANFHGLSMPETMELRRTLRDSGVSYYVAKKSLIRLAFEEAGLEGTLPELEGEIAVAWSEDALAPSREVYKFAKGHDEKFALVGGVYDGAFMDKEAVTALAQIPSLDGLRGMFANVINSPIQRFVISLGQIAEQKA